MEFSNYSWNLTWSVWGLVYVLEYSIKASRHKGYENAGLFMIATVSGVIGAWNLICLLVKLNAIHP